MDDILGQHAWASQLESLVLIRPLDAELEIDLFADVLAACPKLTHFCYMNHPRSRRLKVSAPTAMVQTNLVSLSLSTYLECSQIACLLQSSPGLRMLKLSFAQSIDPQMIVSFCPSITYLHLGSFDWLPGIETRNGSRKEGLQYLCLSSVSHSTSAFLLAHAATLDVLHLPTNIPVSFQSKRLRILSCDASQDRHNNIDDLLEGLPRIHELYLHHIAPTSSLSRAVHRLGPTLGTLKVTVQYGSDDSVLLEMLAFLPNLVSLAYQCQAISSTKLRALAKIKSLETLSVKSTEYAPLVPLTCLEELKVLRRLELWRMAYFSMEPLTHLQRLESIQLQWCVAPVGIRLLAEKAPKNLKKIGLVNCRAVSSEDLQENVMAVRGISLVLQ